MANRAKEAITAMLDWMVDQFIERWPVIVTTIVGGGGMSYLAAISDWLDPYGPVAWGAIGIATIAVIVFLYYLYSIAEQKRTTSQYTKEKSVASTVNVLAPTHENEKIQLMDFYHPFYRPTENVRFQNCDLFGPAPIIFGNGKIHDCHFQDCEILIVRGDRPIAGRIQFQNCTFLDCGLYRVTFLMTWQGYQDSPRVVKDAIPVISDGRVGDV